MFGGNPVELASQIKCPSFLQPAENDPPNVKENGEIVEKLAERFGKEKVGTSLYQDMKHGWVVRGDIKD